MKIIYFSLVLMLISFISCNNETIPYSFSFGLENDFKINGEYHSADNSVQFKITEINDSRCPSDVQCIWAGKVDVQIKVENQVSGIITLSTLNNLVDTVGNYSFTLVEVLPYPISTKTIKLDEYNVTLKIVELAD